MTERFEVVFKTDGPEKDEKVIRDYIKPVVERLENQGLLEGFHFFRYGGEVKFRLYGERGEIEERERSRWKSLKKKGTIKDWELRDYSLETNKYGEKGAEIADTLFEVASKTSLTSLEKFRDKKPKPVDTFSEERGLPAGTWLLIHSFFNQQSYNAGEEINACIQAIQNRLGVIRKQQGVQRAIRVAENIRSHLKKISESMKQPE
ncbi:hypothetical protein AKJ65_05785 [candidate division MSBL1 archaeon SCGC-AAA259E19]|uniref:Thiopeptide-type bacteriocin biosynthesis domain-containing protein n=1 Tax=candidate division MSBL1 archaeon SCGC-AAA259E19 TaxID=1698264 RepID=A0A133UI99_9EURY|nr:hypothetical protein AKJ65_05785 [candidate division MSBL1 archaeon SCGC-AAA259E19]